MQICIEVNFGENIFYYYCNLFLPFDIGPSSQFIRNSEKLGIDIKQIDIVVISRAHMDHLGGFPFFLWTNKIKLCTFQESSTFSI